MGADGRVCRPRDTYSQMHVPMMAFDDRGSAPGECRARVRRNLRVISSRSAFFSSSSSPARLRCEISAGGGGTCRTGFGYGVDPSLLISILAGYDPDGLLVSVRDPSKSKLLYSERGGFSLLGTSMNINVTRKSSSYPSFQELGGDGPVSVCSRKEPPLEPPNVRDCANDGALIESRLRPR